MMFKVGDKVEILSVDRADTTISTRKLFSSDIGTIGTVIGEDVYPYVYPYVDLGHGIIGCFNTNQLKLVTTKTKEKIGGIDIMVKRVVFNNPATIVFWEDGTKTVVKCMDSDTFNEEQGFLQAYYEKMSGLTRTQCNRYIKSICTPKQKQVIQEPFLRRR